MLRLVDGAHAPEPTVAAIGVALRRGAEPNAALKAYINDGVPVQCPALVLLAYSYDRPDCVRHRFLLCQLL